MPETTEQAKPRTWRPMAAWTGAIILALGLAWFVGAVVVPVWQVRRVVLCTDVTNQPSWQYTGKAFRSGLWPHIQSLGGPASASHKLRVYLRCPPAVTPKKEWATTLLRFTERLAAIRCEDEDTCEREHMIWVLGVRVENGVSFNDYEGAGAEEAKK